MKKFKYLLKRFSKAKTNVTNLDKIIKANIIIEQLEHRAISSEESLIDEANKDIIISLTTHSKRIKDVHLTIESLGKQTIKAGKIVLCINKDDFNDDNIPLILKRQVERGLTIKYVVDIRSYTKLLPTLKEFPSANIITVDDDVIYPYYLVEGLHRESLQFPEMAICYRAHRVTKKASGKFEQYNKWPQEIKDTNPGMDIFPTGVGGVYYPAGIFNDECLNYDKASELAPYADDVWFKAMTVLNGKMSKVTSRYFDLSNDFVNITFAQDIGLFNINVDGAKNDEQIKKVFAFYKLHF